MKERKYCFSSKPTQAAPAALSHSAVLLSSSGSGQRSPLPAFAARQRMDLACAVLCWRCCCCVRRPPWTLVGPDLPSQIFKNANMQFPISAYKICFQLPTAPPHPVCRRNPPLSPFFRDSWYDCCLPLITAAMIIPHTHRHTRIHAHTQNAPRTATTSFWLWHPHQSVIPDAHREIL